MNIIQKNLTKHTMYTLVHKTMGTVFTTQIIANERLSQCEEKKVIKHQRLLENYLEQVDARFSTYLNDSEVSLFNRGEIKITEVSDVFIFVFSSCFAAKLATNEAFDANYNDKFDPSGFVKGWSIETGLNNFFKTSF
ncbi:FAD:protein FMN transferase [Lactococcus fujiensis]|uniref:FAD:protein FMN transferase n=1 Tax=Lactococcus fujiensis TaxID=610251 RepID=UPI0006D07338|nr:FAD:protein FMN transferase [Lactococcus fujiensis]